MIETIRLWYNKARIFLLSKFTNRIRHIKVKDLNGKDHRVTIETNTEKICDHKTIKEIATTLWKCQGNNCDAYFQINYKVMLNEVDLYKYMEQIADHFDVTVQDNDTVSGNGKA